MTQAELIARLVNALALAAPYVETCADDGTEFSESDITAIHDALACAKDAGFVPIEIEEAQ